MNATPVPASCVGIFFEPYFAQFGDYDNFREYLAAFTSPDSFKKYGQYYKDNNLIRRLSAATFERSPYMIDGEAYIYYGTSARFSVFSDEFKSKEEMYPRVGFVCEFLKVKAVYTYRRAIRRYVVHYIFPMTHFPHPYVRQWFGARW